MAKKSKGGRQSAGKNIGRQRNKGSKGGQRGRTDSRVLQNQADDWYVQNDKEE